jgi:hypothetical protein
MISFSGGSTQRAFVKVDFQFPEYFGDIEEQGCIVIYDTPLLLRFLCLCVWPLKYGRMKFMDVNQKFRFTFRAKEGELDQDCVHQNPCPRFALASRTQNPMFPLAWFLVHLTTSILWRSVTRQLTNIHGHYASAMPP